MLYQKINQDTGRPAVIVSNNDINESQNMVEVVYLVEKPNESLPTHAKVRCHLPSTALCEQVVSVSKDRIDGFIRTCTDEEIEKINKGLSISLGITESDDTMAEKLKELTDSLSEAQRINDGLRNRIKEETDKQQELKQLSQPENTDETIKVAAERDIYKDLYMKLTEKLIGDKI
ncbi:type II toxin-antitoxin system PemK/MazF family toxin [Dorea formicigenerans]|uniref:Type II toxin-antitoxin system PemK/MazF family toxin n=1 Tax=Dorea formicigenerans TaxID=39486 RepID=A0A413QN03_9FIRM|nr:type II toxin-antitoxin system PemK/MazF family toxin [Dorea formicigenerans]